MNGWYKDAILYEIYPITFNDANGDGMGDFKGIEEKLDYLCDLGINTIWVSAFTDAGYDVTDYYDVDGRFGNLEDLVSLLSQCKKRGIKVIMEIWFSGILPRNTLGFLHPAKRKGINIPIIIF